MTKVLGYVGTPEPLFTPASSPASQAWVDVDSPTDVDAKIAAAIAAEVIARNAAIATSLASAEAYTDTAIAAVVDVSGYVPTFVPGVGTDVLLTAPDNFQTIRIDDRVIVTGTMVVDSNMSPGSLSGPIGTFTLPAFLLGGTTLGSAIAAASADTTDVFPIIGLEATGDTVTIVSYGQAQGFTVPFAVTIVIQISP